ncbi:MAG: hypothetical protein FWH12_03300 [Treponema sp.]|nr:hypothetical protein [Treponema sp.]
MDYRINGIIAGIAFIISLLIGFISRAAPPALLVRPLIFAVLSFFATSLINYLVSTFLPELLEGGQEEVDPGVFAGSRIDIMEGEGSGLSPNFGPARASMPSFMSSLAYDSDKRVEDIADLKSRNDLYSMQAEPAREDLERPQAPVGMDQNEEEGYTETGETQVFSPEPSSAPLSMPERPLEAGIGGGSSSLDEVLPDLDSMAGAFRQTSSEEEPETNDFVVPSPARKSTSSRDTPAWAAELNAKDMAMGLQTVLSREKEG